MSLCGKKQTTFAPSSIESEYVALNAVTSEGLWIKGIIHYKHIFYTNDALALYEAIAGWIAITKNMESETCKQIANITHIKIWF